MPLDVQIQNQTLLSLVQGNVQQALNTTCVPPLPPFYFDHRFALRLRVYQ
jgi:hypothetical protein